MTQDEWDVAARWGAAVDRALRWLPGDSACLVRASALRQLVVNRGLPLATVRIGVRRQASGFEAHAWVEHDGTPIAEPDRLRGAFNSLSGVTLR
jgi:Transglutaminase-like superfamily